MALNFIRTIVEGNADSFAHRKFVRYGLGEFEKELLSVKVGSSIQVSAGFEYVDVMLRFLAKLADRSLALSGVAVGKGLEPGLKAAGAEIVKSRGSKLTIKASMAPDRFRKFLDDFSDAIILCDVSCGLRTLKVKKSPPKPGTTVKKFMSASFGKEDLKLVKDELMFDIEGSPKKVEIRHRYVIESIDIPKQFENDSVQARLNAVRKGKIIREITADWKTTSKEYRLRA